MDMIGGILAIVYVAWAMYSGWKYINGRYKILEQDGIVFLFLKIAASLVVGLFYGVYYFWVMIFKLFKIFKF